MQSLKLLKSEYHDECSAGNLVESLGDLGRFARFCCLLSAVWPDGGAQLAG